LSGTRGTGMDRQQLIAILFVLMMVGSSILYGVTALF
jgi:hypothetical protein